MKIIPRPYQIEAQKKALLALKKSGKALIVLATGLGKTIASALIVKSLGKLPGIFLVHNNDILERSVGEFQKVFGDNIRCGLYNGHSKEVKGCDIVFASFQTMVRNLKRFKHNQFAWMIVDEGHHGQAETYRKVIEYFHCAKLGVTATPDRMDMKNIRDLFGNEVVNISLEEAIARGWLPKIEYHLVTDEGLDEDRLKQLAKEIREEGRRISIQEINRRVFIKARDEKIAEIIEGYTEKTIIFCRNVHHAENFKVCLLHGETYHSKNSRERNRKSLQNLRNGLTRRILAVNAFNEGIDVPDVGLVVFNRATDSETIFRQQLGRGMRPGKDKLIVLDFVGNAERIAMLKKMTDTIADYHEKFTTREERELEGYSKNTFHLSGKGFEFTFADKVVEIMTMVDRANVEFYPTWQEASRVARNLGIKGREEYMRRYKEDARLRVDPHKRYLDFPGYDVFLTGNKKVIHYPTWRLAAKAAKKIGLTTSTDYLGRYKEDPRLPSKPDATYSDFPGWATFFGRKEKKFFSSWRDARKSVRKLGITSPIEYYKCYKSDPRLPSNPRDTYKDFPGWPTFLGRETMVRSKDDIYPTWQEASKAAIRLGITRSGREYANVYKKDKRLPGNPNGAYPNFPGWLKFLGRSEVFTRDAYPNWKEASKAAIRLGIQTGREHHKRYREDNLLVSHPDTFYPDFPGWDKYLGKM